MSWITERLGLPWPERIAEVASAASAILLTSLGAIFVLRLWHADLHVPFLYLQDANLNLMVVKGIDENGWYLRNPHLAAPFGQELHDFPVFSGDHLNVVLIKALALLTDDAAVVVNLFFLLTFPLAALAAYVVLRCLGITRYSAVAASTVFALLPYHFLRGEGHLLLSAYYAVPFGCFLVLAVLRGHDLFAQDRGARSLLRRFATKRTLTTLAFCLVVATASGSFYYSGFTMLLVVLVAPLGARVTRDVRVLATGAGIVVVLLAVSLIQLAPTLWYQHVHGKNELVGQREPHESEYYSLKLTQLVLPLPNHRVGFLASQRRDYDAWPVGPKTEADVATLGIIGTLGFFGSIAALIAASLTSQRRRPNELVVAAGIVTLLAFLTATRGGFSSIIGSISPQLRAWNRLSIFIAFLSLLTVAVALDWLGRWLRAHRVPSRLVAALLVAFVGLGVAEQTADYFAVPYAYVKAQYTTDAAFVTQVERAVPRGASIFELPYASFPESSPPPPGRQLVYDHVRPYLHSNTIDWSFGAPRGRPADWAARLADRPLPRVVRAVAAVGFAGIYVDRSGYDDNGKVAVATLIKTLSLDPLRSPDGRFLFFDLRGYAANLRKTWSKGRIQQLCIQTLGGAGESHCRP